MKSLTATEVRKSWFRVLDEVVSGAVVVVNRRGQRVVLKRLEEGPRSGEKPAPDYRTCLRAAELDQADQWGWVWKEDGPLVPTQAPAVKQRRGRR